MSISDPIADLLTRIRNALIVEQQVVAIPSSKLKLSIVEILKEEGFVDDFEEVQLDGRPHKTIRIQLKYVGKRRERQSVINGLLRISKPGRRVYVGRQDIPWVQSGLGIAIMTTPKGVMTGVRARQLGVGGEVLCEVW